MPKFAPEFQRRSPAGGKSNSRLPASLLNWNSNGRFAAEERGDDGGQFVLVDGFVEIGGGAGGQGARFGFFRRIAGDDDDRNAFDFVHPLHPVERPKTVV